MSENRASVRETLQAAGTPTDVGNVGKALGARWKALSDDERKEFKIRADAKNSEAAELAPGHEGKVTERAPPARAQAHGTGRTTAYFLFSSENRSAVRDELQAEGLTVDVGSVGKALGARWKALTEDKRQEYKDRAGDRNTEAAELAARQPQPDEAEGARQAESAGQQAGGDEGPALPFGRVKRIMNLDRDVKQVSKDAVCLVIEATELFLHELVEGASRFMKKRRTMQLGDIEQCVLQYEHNSFLSAYFSENIEKRRTKEGVEQDAYRSKDAVDTEGSEAVEHAEGVQLAARSDSKKKVQAGRRSTSQAIAKGVPNSRQITHFFMMRNGGLDRDASSGVSSQKTVDATDRTLAMHKENVVQCENRTGNQASKTESSVLSSVSMAEDTCIVEACA